MAILGGNSACLVGVAISASLLPPIINSGILWSLSLVKVLKSVTQDPIEVNVTGTTMLVPPSFLAPSNYQPYYFDEFSMHKECAVLGVVSFCLTVVNILCIIMSGTLVARDYNKTLGEDMGKEFLKEWQQLDDTKGGDAANDLQDLQDILDNFVRCLSRTFSVPDERRAAPSYGTRMNVWEVESLLEESARAKKPPRVTFQLKRSKSETRDTDPKSPSGREKKGRKGPGFFHFRPSASRFEVSRVDEQPEPLLRKMRRLYHSTGQPSTTSA
ncbi:hypothetical protein IscW_ISCW012364 [Ixodes scapularis]|uniref:Uncharacterized protein n=1 Tax=Ixodes scapularis TaxID=6945 RepID=B7QEM5_IXOSC|nr:hypothetical protein IscW_ISCW012364 [Ixodes scapularis]|eukprot:XP_002413989.1 hypothetical protein IscW_ISCW012364 [Ixodes scapularis]